jgi:membrane protease YdiL (CAAX protease family)
LGPARPTRRDADLAGSRLLSTEDLPPPDLRQRRWGIREALIGLVLGNLVTLLALLGRLTGGESEQSSDLDIAFVAFMLLNIPVWAGYLVMPWLAARRNRRTISEEFQLRPTLRDAFLGVPTGLATQLVLIPLLYLLIWWLGDLVGWHISRDISGEAEKVADLVKGPVDVVLILLMVGVIAPVVEETFFRGMFLGAFRAKWGTGWGVAISAVAFGAVHMQPLQFPALVLFGVVLALLVVRTGRLGAAICAHMVFNITSTLVLLTTEHLDKASLLIDRSG